MFFVNGPRHKTNSRHLHRKVALKSRRFFTCGAQRQASEAIRAVRLANKSWHLGKYWPDFTIITILVTLLQVSLNSDLEIYF